MNGKSDSFITGIFDFSDDEIRQGDPDCNFDCDPEPEPETED